MTYISRKLLSNERNYSTVEKEALAIKWALDKLRYYLLGREFTLVTDHAPLKWMASAKDTNTHVTRWFLAFQDYRFQVDHRPGREHGTLSRREACLALVRDNLRLHPAVKECGNPGPTRPRRPDGPDSQTAQRRGGGGRVPPISTGWRQRERPLHPLCQRNRASPLPPASVGGEDQVPFKSPLNVLLGGRAGSKLRRGTIRDPIRTVNQWI